MAEDIGILSGLTPREDYIPKIQSAYGSIIQNAPDYQYFTAPLSNLGNTTATYGGQNNIVVAPDTPIRVVNNATGEVIYSGTGYEGAQKAIDAASALSSSAGNKANWDIQVVRPGGQDFESVSTDRPNSRTLGLLADIALPIAGSFIPGVGPVLGAALGSGASSVAQGRSLEDTLMRAAIAAGGSYLGGQVLGKAGAGASSGSSAINADLIPNALSGLNFGSIASTAIPAGVGGAATNLTGDLLVTAIRNAAPSTTGSIVGTTVANAVPNAVNTSQPSTTKADTVTRDEYGNVVDDTGAIVATAGGKAPTNILPAALATGAAATAAAAANATGATTTAAEQAATRTSLTPEQSAAITGGAGAATGAGGVFGTGLSLAQLASITGIGVDLLGKLIGGGGDEGATTPYTSPFGAGPTFAPAARTQINPNIADYERYGFGPEAMFFSAGQANPGAVATPSTTTTTGTTTGQTGVISQPRMTNTTNDEVVVPATTTAPTLLPNMVSSLGPTATSAQIEGALANAKTAQEATKINPGTVYYNIDTATADALGDRGLIGDVMSIQQLQQAMAARELTDPNKFATNLFQQIGEQYNKGVLNIDQARAIQQQIQQEQARTGASTQNMQNIFNTAMQQYTPLI